MHHWIALNKTIKTRSYFNIFRWYFFHAVPKKHFCWKLKAHRNKLWSNLVNVQIQKKLLDFRLPPPTSLAAERTQSEPPLLIQLPLVELLDLQSCLAKFFTCTLLVKSHPHPVLFVEAAKCRWQKNRHANLCVLAVMLQKNA